jgi:hypothetical protein
MKKMITGISFEALLITDEYMARWGFKSADLSSHNKLN